MPSKHRGGLTLVEVTVACAIAMILSATLGRLFYNSLHWQARALRQTSLQQQLKVAMQRICSDLQLSAPRGIAVGANIVSIQKLANLSTDIPPRLFWETELGVYFVDGTGLHRRPWPPAPPDLGIELNAAVPFQPNSAQLTQLRSGGRAVLLGRNVTALVVGSPQSMPLQISISVSDLDQHFSSTRTLSLRNAE